MEGYIMGLRRLVGHIPLLQCAASVMIVDEKGRLLLGKRSDSGYWGYSGGSVELDEPVEACAKRELYEEMGITPKELTFFMINSGPETHYIYPNGDEVSNVEIVYISHGFEGVPRAIDGEHTELRFFELSELSMDMINPPIRPVIREYIRTQKGNNNEL